MFRSFARLAAMALWTLVLSSGARGEDRLAWPQFRGPGGSGVADDQQPPVEIGPDKNVKWKVPVPSGISSPIVAGKLLVITAFEDEKLYTIAYDRGDGKEVWRAAAPTSQIEKFLKSDGSPAASTCATDGQRIVSYFGSCGLVCYDLAGKELWKYDLPMAETVFGSGTSPILAHGAVILVRDEPKGSKIIALDAATGGLQWEQKRQSPMSYSTPLVWDTPGGKQVVVAGHARMIGYDLASGEEKWSVAGIPSGCCSSPVTAAGTLYFAGTSPGGPEDTESQMPSFDAFLKESKADTNGDGILSKEEADKTMLKDFFDVQDANKDGNLTRDEWDFIRKFMSEGRNVAFALKPGGSGDVTETHLLWKQTKGLPYIPSAIVYRGQYVMLKDGGIVTALDMKTGKETYQKRAIATGNYYASPVAAGGHIYFVSLLDGAVTVLKAGAKSPEVVAKNDPLGERVAATPAIADDTLYVRTAGHLYAFGK
jgi:outer membrane protein assembly factor BamB